MMMLWLADVLRDAGLETIEKPGWQTRGRNTMNPQGVVCHHTGGALPSSDSAYADFLIRGRSDLPGPLSQLYLDRQGRYWVLAAGKANHAGTGGWRGLVGNSSVVGIEAAHTGAASLAWPDDQLQAYKVGVAAVLKKIGKNADFVCGHKEWATPAGRKVDPVSIDMNQFRRDVAQIMVGSTVEVPVDRLTPDEIRKLRALIASWEKVGSNATFPQHLIPWFREVKDRI